ncbi:TonB family protein [Spirosoma sp. HMF4905]|uniref:TonB family protein n=1 Tax=Spirosoma arboris TaxID=2682092 RepID=A0A7K1SD97_9BACT|nr:TonB family protein [Spirosoma arboris]MVM31787.1 TonB family protein [Spirosoma arboris]
MKIVLSLLLLLCCSVAIAQQDIYQSFEVDSAATPRGGITTFNTFLQANLRKPILAESKGIGGVVVVNGIVEPDGHVSSVTLIKSIRPDCDREAIRVFSLYRAWKPAQKAGKVVRQQISMPIVFKPNTPFSYEHGEKITYLDADINILPDSNQRVKFKEVSPLDTNGLPTDDLVLYKFINQRWEEYARDTLVRIKNVQPDLAGQPSYSLGHQQALLKLNGDLYVVDATGKRLTASHYRTGKLFGQQFVYHANGAIAERKEYDDNKQAIVSWYSNGQIQHVRELITGSTLEPAVIEKVTSFWDSTGRQLVKNGNGWAEYSRKIKSYRDNSPETSVVEQGVFKDYFKQGVWTGHYADSSYSYEEQYDKGVLIAGKSSLAGQEMTDYRVEDRMPVFSGGMLGLKQFLSQNLQYPIRAQQASVEGQVVVSFSVCTDGTLCDYEVIKSVQPDLDREALRVVKKTSGRWIPGIQHGKKVQVNYVMPVNFSLY